MLSFGFQGDQSLTSLRPCPLKEAMLKPQIALAKPQALHQKRTPGSPTVSLRPNVCLSLRVGVCTRLGGGLLGGTHGSVLPVLLLLALW